MGYKNIRKTVKLPYRESKMASHPSFAEKHYKIEEHTMFLRKAYFSIVVECVRAARHEKNESTNLALERLLMNGFFDC